MRHKKAGKKFGRNPSHRKAMFRNMVTSLFKFEKIETTDVKAKAIRPIAEKLITLAKRGDLHSRRLAMAYIREKPVTYKLFGELKDRYLEKQGGYIRIIKKGVRKGDAAPVSIVQLIPRDDLSSSKKKTVPDKTSTKDSKLTVKDDNITETEEKASDNIENVNDSESSDSETT